MKTTVPRCKSLWLYCLLLLISPVSAWSADFGEVTGMQMDPFGRNIVTSGKGGTSNDAAWGTTRASEILPVPDPWLPGQKAGGVS